MDKMTTNSPYTPLTTQESVIKFIRDIFRQEVEGNIMLRKGAKKDFLRFLIRTDDGSYTLKSEEFQGKSENMHTSKGAITESLEKFVKPSLLREKEDIRVLDICSGLGYNAAALIEDLNLISNQKIKLKLDMIEISLETLAASLLIPSPLSSHDVVKKAYEEKLIKEGFAKLQEIESLIPSNIRFNIFIEDAREVICNLQDLQYDAIFLDPFSPSKSPELFSVEFLSELKRIIKRDGVIITYTSAAPVRAGFIKVGFHIGEGPIFGRKSGGTVASLSLENIKRDISVDDERMIALSDSGIPFKDPELNLTAYEILQNRSIERKKARGNYKLASTVKTPLYLGKDIQKNRLGRRVIRNMNQLKLDDPKSEKALYLICHQFERCICGCDEPRIHNSRDRIKKMSERLLSL